LNIFLRETIKNYLFYEYQKGKQLSPNSLIAYITDKYNDEDFPDDYFICLLVGVLDTTKNQVTFANAGFQFPPLKITNEGNLSSLDCKGLPISSAISPQLIKDDSQEIRIGLNPGDSLFLTTDGLLEEQVNGKMYGQSRLKEILTINYNLPVDLINKKVKNDFESFSGGLVGQDDLTFMTLKRDLDIIDNFKKAINSNIEAMYKVKEEILNFIDSYSQMTSLICMGVQEIVTNAIEHGNDFDSDKEVKIKIEVTKGYIKVIITDQGEGFDWKKRVKKQLDIESDFNNEKERGRGIKLAKEAYDEIWYNEKGNIAYLLKLRR